MKRHTFKNLNASLIYFCETKISRSMIPNEIMPNILDHGLWVANGGNHIGISSHVKMLSTFAPLMKMNAQTLEPQGVNEKQYLQRSEIQHQVYLPQSFMLVDIIFNDFGVLISSSVPNDYKEKVYYISKTRAPNNVLGAIIMVYQTPLYYVETLIIDIQPKANNDMLINNHIG